MYKVVEFMGRKQYDMITESYPASTKALIERDTHQFEQRFPEVNRRLESCLYNADNRSIYNYGYNVAKSWVIEDFIIKLYNVWTPWKAISSGSDSDRVIASRNKVTNLPDIMINYDGGIVAIELITDYYSNTKNNGKYFLRDNKLQNLIKSSKSRKTLIMFVDIPTREFFIVDVKDIKYRRTTRWGKPASEVRNECVFVPITKDNLIKYTEFAVKK